MDLQVRDECLRNSFKETSEMSKNILIDNNDKDLENYLNQDYNVYLRMMDYEYRHLDLNKVNTVFVDKEMAIHLEHGVQDEQRILELLLKRFPNLRIVLITKNKGAYYKDKDMMIYQKELTDHFDYNQFLVNYMTSELKGNSEMTSLYRGVNQ